MRLYICTLIYTHSVLVQFCIRSHGFSLVTSHSQYLNAGPRVQGTDNSASPMEAFAQRSTSPRRKSLKDLFLSSAPMWGSDHKCLQEAHPHRPLPPLHLTPPPESEVWYSRLPPQQSWMDLQTGFCPGRGKEPYVQNVLMAGEWLPQMSSCRGAEKEAKCVSEWRPKTRVLLPYIKGISEKISRACRPLDIQAIFTSKNTLRKFLTQWMEDWKWWMWRALCTQFPCSYLCWWDAEGLYGGAQEGGEEQWFQQWNHHACPKDCKPSTGRSKELMGGSITGEEGFLKKPWNPPEKTDDEPRCWPDSGSIVDSFCICKGW